MIHIVIPYIYDFHSDAGLGPANRDENGDPIKPSAPNKQRITYGVDDVEAINRRMKELGIDRS